MYVTFALKERDGSFYINELSIGFCYKEPVESDFYVKDFDHPEIFLPGQGGFNAESYYSPYNGYPQYRFNPEKYFAGENPFEHFDPIINEYFRSADRRTRISQDIRAIISDSTELKTARLLINSLFQALVDNNLVENIPDELLEWNAAVQDGISAHSKDQDDPLYLDGRDDLIYTETKSMPDGADPDLWIRHKHRSAQNVTTGFSVAAAAQGKGPLKTWEAVKARGQRRKKVKDGKK